MSTFYNLHYEGDDFLPGDYIMVQIGLKFYSCKVIDVEENKLLIGRHNAVYNNYDIYFVEKNKCYLLYYEGMQEVDLVEDGEE